MKILNLHNLLPKLAMLALAGGATHADNAPLEAFAEQLVLPTYQTLAERSVVLANASETAATEPTERAVENARRAWIDARVPWERSEAFLFGPVDTEGHDPYLDSWPINVTDLQKVIDPATGPAEIDTETVESLTEGLRGFHVVEYLLFADAGGNPATSSQVAKALENDPRRAAYLAASARALEIQAGALLADYSPEGGNFIGLIETAGEGSEVYLTRGAAYSDIANALAGIAEESSQVKLLEPALKSDITILESRFSENTLSDVLDNIEGIQQATILVLDPILEDNALRQRLMEAIALYRNRVEAIPTVFDTDPASVKEAVEKAAEAGAAVQAILEDEVVPTVRSA